VDSSGKILDEINKKVGIRKIDLRMNEKERQTFLFRVNNKVIYVKGMNWIPADSFLPRVNNIKYRNLLTFAGDANANMIRVWGGGIYENDDFYDQCDRLGLLVWQDFMFACAAYPEDKEFMKLISEEIIQNVDRLRNHPCIAIWCGNNENEWIFYREMHKSYKEMPGYKIFHQFMPALVKKLDPDRPFWPTTPFGFDKDPNSQTSGNRHQWDIWSNWIDYTRVKYDQSLFVTEFGFQGPANIETFNKILPVEKRKIQGSAFEYYNKQIEGSERIIRFLAGHLPLRLEWEDFIYLAQLNQGLALKTCIEHWRTNKITGGSIVWQLNDCWPVTSWSLIDSDIKPKISYHFVKNIFSKAIIFFGKSGENLSISLLNEGEQGKAVYEMIIIDSKVGSYLSKASKKISLDNRKFIGLDKFNISKLPEDKNWIVITTIYDSSKKIIHRNYYLEKEWKHIKLPAARIRINTTKKSDRNILVISTNKPAFFIDIYHPGLTFVERGFILLPGENKNLEINEKNKTIRKDAVKIFKLNDYLK
jgi:beta-mannosidase